MYVDNFSPTVFHNKLKVLSVVRGEAVNGTVLGAASEVDGGQVFRACDGIAHVGSRARNKVDDAYNNVIDVATNISPIPAGKPDSLRVLNTM